LQNADVAPCEATPLIYLDNIVRDAHPWRAVGELLVNHCVEEPHRLGVGAQARQGFPGVRTRTATNSCVLVESVSSAVRILGHLSQQ
jgi:hypothetical protein